MTEKEKIMYKIMGSLYNQEVPLIFKGALVTKAVLFENLFFEIERQTKDIDANWIGSPPDLNYLSNVITDAIKKVDDSFEAIAIRDFSEKKSAGIKIVDKNYNEVLTMDIKISPLVDTRTYYYGDITFKGVTVNQILCDKISAISTDKVFRRIKDVVDVYALSHCIEVSTSDIYDVAFLTKRKFSDFDAFLNRVGELEHAYNKFKGIENKPQFKEVYSFTKIFLEPFTTVYNNLIWDISDYCWNEPNENLKDKNQYIDDELIR